MPSHKVFVSSVIEGMTNEREAAEEAIKICQKEPIMAEYLGGPHPPDRTLEEKIKESDIFILILGKTYGTIIPEDNYSGTEWEYRIARSSGKPIFIYVLYFNAMEEKQKGFLSRVGAFHGGSFWKKISSIEKLKNEIEKDLREFQEQYFIDLEFVNRQEELRKLCDPDFNQCIEFYAPAGFGKTYLLKKAFDKHQVGSIIKWQCYFIDFTNKELRYDESKILELILKQFEVEEQRADFDGKRAQLLRCLQDNKNMSFAFFIDSTELASEDVKNWVKNTLIPEVQIEAKARFILSGRYPILKPNPFYAYYSFPLSSFDDRYIIKRLITQMEYITKFKLDRETNEFLEEYILQVSCGHPKCIKLLLETVYRGKTPIKINELKRLKNDLFEEKTIRTINREVLDTPEIRREYNKLEDIFKVICIFRILFFFRNSISPLEKERLIEKGKFESKSYDKILQQMSSTFLFEEFLDYGYKINPVIRKTLSMRLEFSDEQKFRTIHNFAMKLYDKWINQRIPNEFARLCIVEWLYHKLYLCYLNKLFDEDNKTKLKNQILKYFKICLNRIIIDVKDQEKPIDAEEHFKISFINVFKDMIRKDHEISNLYTEIFNEPIEAFLTSLTLK